MRISTRRRWKTQTSLAVAVAVMAATALDAQSIEDTHLTIIPRTEAEQARIGAVIKPARDFSKPEPFEDRPAGAATVRARRDADAFSQPSGNISFERELDFRIGNGLFKKLWVSSPSSTLASDGLGPLYNARSCQRCHIKDGRGHPPSGPDDNAVSMILRISIPGGRDDFGIDGYFPTQPEPSYGGQLQDVSIPGHQSEFKLQVSYREVPVPLSGGEVINLRVPEYKATNLGYGPLDERARLSPRVAPQMIGLGLLEAIPVDDILAHADEADRDGDGISGRPNIVWSKEFDRPMLGRFGLKAGSPTVNEQSAAAFSGDIGISSPLFPQGWGDCTKRQTKCQMAPDGAGDTRGHEIDAAAVELVTYYSRNLGVPARVNMADPAVLRGKRVFYETGCTGCHVPKFVTARLADRPEQSFQLIWPYSDLLLHDMGEGLADHRPEARATGREWRTPPLWGIGRTEQVSGHTLYLHDGRARSLLEAVLWHGGEAERHREAVIAMPKADRDDLIEFLESL